MIKNIVLDVGRVLVHWDPIFAMHKLGFSEETTTRIHDGIIESGKWDFEDKGCMTEDEVLKSFQNLMPDIADEIKMFWDNIDMAIWQFDDSEAWINKFKQAGYKVYILSNYGAHTYEKTKDSALGFLKLVDGITFSYKAKLVKPDPEIYRYMLRQHGLKADECVFIDDRAENVAAAVNEGIKGIIYKSREQVGTELVQYGVSI